MDLVAATKLPLPLYPSTAVQAKQPGYLLNICMVPGLRGETKDTAIEATTSQKRKPLPSLTLG
jgi:hypothetical protein